MLWIAKHKVAICLVAIAMIGFFLPLISVVMSVFLLSCVFTRKYNFNLFLALVSGLVIYILAGVLLMHIIYMLHFAFRFDLIYLVLSLIAIIYAVWSNFSVYDLRLTSRDIIHFVVLFGVFLFLVIPLIGASQSKTLEFLHLGGEDNSSQFQMYHYVINDKTFAYNNKPEDSGVRQSLTSYPQGSHAALALVTEPFLVTHNSTAHLLKMYAFGFSFFYAVFIYLIFAICILPLRRLKRRSPSFLAELIVGTIVVSVGGVGVFLDLFVFGFFGHILAYVGFLAVLFWVGVTTYVMEEEEEEEVSGIVEKLIFSLLAFFLVYASWYILAPIALIPIVCYLWPHREIITKNYKIFLSVVALPIVVCLYLTYVYLFTSTDMNHILTPGGVTHLEPWLLLLVIPAGVLSWAHFKKKQWVELAFELTLLTSAILTLLIGLYQYKKLGGLEYYFYKMLYTVLVLYMIVYIRNITVVAAHSLDKIKGSNFNLSSGVVMVCLVIGCSLVYTSLPAKAYFESKYTLVQNDEKRVLDLLLRDDNVTEYNDAFFVGSCDPYLNYLGMIWSGSFHLSYLAGRDKLEVAMLSHSDSDLAKDMNNYSRLSHDKIVVYVVGSCNTALISAIRENIAYKLDYSYR